MSLLDRQIASVRSRLTLGQFFSALGFSLAGFALLVLLVILVDRFFWFDLPHQKALFWAVLAVTLILTNIYATLRRPSAHSAAVLIDRTLNLHEKFSTALYARSQLDHDDPFVAAALFDAEQSATQVSLHRRFPLKFPRSGYYAIASAILVLLIAQLVPRVDLFDHHARQAALQKQIAEKITAQQDAHKTLATVSALPASVQNQQKVELAKKQLQQALDQNLDPAVLKLTTQKAEEEARAARQEDLKSNPQYAQAMTDKAVFNALNASTDDQGPVADATRDIADGNFAKAADELQSLPEKFARMTPQEQQKAADQMQTTADQLNKIASDPAPMQAAQQQLKQNGATTRQSQELAQASQQAAQGDTQAQQKLQQLQKQIAQQTSQQSPQQNHQQNKQQNPATRPSTPQQQQLQKATQQMQSVASSQSKAQQLANAALRLAQGMKMSQAPKQGGSQSGKQMANAQTGNSQQPGPQQGGQTPSGQPGGTQQANASKPDGQAPGGNQPGQTPGQGQGQGQMQQAASQMAQTASQMGQTQSGADQLASGNQPSEPSAKNPGNGKSDAGSKPGPTAKGNSPAPPGGSAAGTTGTGSLNGNPNPAQSSPLAIKPETVPTQNLPAGRILAKSYVKADPIIGKSTIQLSPEAKSAVRQSTDDVSEDTVPRDAQQAVKDYFDTVQNSSGK